MGRRCVRRARGFGVTAFLKNAENIVVLSIGKRPDQQTGPI